MVTATLHHPARSLSNALNDWLHGAWLSMQEAGNARAAYRLDQMARSYELSQPGLARQFRAAAAQCRKA